MWVIQFNWAKDVLTVWSVFYLSNCFHSALSSHPVSVVPFSEAPNLSAVPEEYDNLEEAYSDQQALLLPSNQPYDFGISWSTTSF